jgi:long-chain acyl-CoA synthetase
MEKVWLESYPAGVPAEVDVTRYGSIADVFTTACGRFAERPSLRSMGVTLSFKEVEEKSAAFASYLQRDLGLQKGDRIAIQMPNVLQYPIVLFGALRAGLVVVNTNPLYTEREMELQFNDADVSAIVILENFASKLEAIWPNLKRKPHVIVSGLADLFPGLKRTIVSLVVRHVKKLVPAFHLPSAVPLRRVLSRGAELGAPVRVELSRSDLAFLQYTGGTTGVAKGAMLTHGNVIANMEQAAAWMAPRLTEGKEVILTPLPLYHIFSLTVNCLLFLRYGALSVLVANPRDFPAFIKLLQTERFTVMTAVSTLLNALMNQPGFERIDWSGLKFTVAGAMALQRSVAERWAKETKTPVIEGYGLTEASPVVCCNPLDGRDRVGTIGLPFPSTEVRLLDDDGNPSAPGESGELVVKGPQVMQGYWNKPEETTNVLRDGWLYTGDIAKMDEAGFLSIVDRKKDLIIVSGFNVYPNEVEDVVCSHPKVQEAGAIGIPDEKSGEVVKVVVVKKDQSLTEEELLAHAKANLSAYKVPKVVEFRTELPKTNVGKILRRALR